MDAHLPRLLIFPALLLSTLTLELILMPAQTGRSRESQLASPSVFKCTPPPSPGGSGISSVYGQRKICLLDPWSPRSSEKPTGHLAFRPFLRSVLFHVLVLELETPERQDELRPYAPNSALADCLGDSAREDLTVRNEEPGNQGKATFIGCRDLCVYGGGGRVWKDWGLLWDLWERETLEQEDGEWRVLLRWDLITPY